ncbi:MAG: Nif3-like dinuclear metal center hexameric protein [Planctomycetes bacterium]|nr:Nif3-like dinuclear metal center hexameric protein [Planctomycetota bacterium]
MPRKSKIESVGDVHDALDAIAPFRHAADWDNVGLLAGRREWPVRAAMLAIDLTDAVAGEAISRGVDLLIVYHPPIFKGIKSVTPHAEGPTSLLPDLLAERIAIIALHTALDHAEGGTNDVLLDAFETASRRPLQPIVHEADGYKLVVFVPAAEVDRLREALSAAGAGVIGHYSHCSYELRGQGTFIGDGTTKPAIGRKQTLERVDEVRLEMVVPPGRVGHVVRALHANHSYEEPAFDLYSTTEVADRGRIGSGRIGRLRKPQRGTALLKKLSERVDLRQAQSVGNLKRLFSSVTAAAGSFGVRDFDDPDSLVLTGEFKHHDALDLLRRGITALALDHYASERPALASVRKRLSRRLNGVKLTISRSDRSPFSAIAGRSSANRVQ